MKISIFRDRPYKRYIPKLGDILITKTNKWRVSCIDLWTTRLVSELDNSALFFYLADLRKWILETKSTIIVNKAKEK